MLEIPFNFKTIGIERIVGKPTMQTPIERLYGLDKKNDRFIIAYLPIDVNAQEYLYNEYNVDVHAVMYGHVIHDMVPRPELSGKDYASMLDQIKNPHDRLYIYYAADLVNKKISFDTFTAGCITEARHTAATELSDRLNMKILTKNLMLNPVRDKRTEHSYNLMNAYVGRTTDMNPFYTYDRYLVGCVRCMDSLRETLIKDSWIYHHTGKEA